MTAAEPPRPQGSATLTFAGGGWVLALAGLLVLALLGWSLAGVLIGHRPTGDGRTLESYRFDLSNLLVAKDSLRPSGNPRGFLPSLDGPAHLRGAEMLVYNEQNRPKYVVTTDRVIGAVIDGQAHAWPLSMMNAHEVVNDTVGGRPVVATYSPLCDSAVVFDRRVGGVERLFEVSGLLSDSNLVFCDKSAVGVATDAHVPSLFVQLERRAVAGPLAASATMLEPVAGVCITTWADWLLAHPDTTVTLRDPQMIRRMKEISYARYFLSPTLEYPAEPMPEEAFLAARGLRLKSPMLAVLCEGIWRVYSVEELSARASVGGQVRVAICGRTLLVDIPAGPAVARARWEDGEAPVTVPVLLFAVPAVLEGREPVEFPPLAGG